MEKFILILKGIAYSAIMLFVVQIVNLYLPIFKPSQTHVYLSAVIGLTCLFLSVMFNKALEKKKYTKKDNIRR
tara:strand:- start:211 stop:429 length:219 start_codon:yes stop_codon:yes gene_type:complete